MVQTLLVIAPEDRERFQEKWAGNAALMSVEVVEGGVERVDSVVRALERVRPQAEFVAVHDAVRPWLASAWNRRRVCRCGQERGRDPGGLIGRPVAGTAATVGEVR